MYLSIHPCTRALMHACTHQSTKLSIYRDLPLMYSTIPLRAPSHSLPINHRAISINIIIIIITTTTHVQHDVLHDVDSTAD